MYTSGRIVAVAAAVGLSGAVGAAPAAVTDGEGDVKHTGPTAATPDDRAGPPRDLPEAVPGFVERLLGPIRGTVTDLVAAGTVG